MRVRYGMAVGWWLVGPPPMLQEVWYVTCLGGLDAGAVELEQIAGGGDQLPFRMDGRQSARVNRRILRACLVCPNRVSTLQERIRIIRLPVLVSGRRCMASTRWSVVNAVG
jgi:hypothetical protein